MKRKTRNKDPVCLEEPWKRARSVLLECIEGEEYLFFLFFFFSGAGGGELSNLAIVMGRGYA